ncbi:di-heme oxidoredictase family protein [Owenweeksia hongkongensis]|uniref:di-heme oxidoreductase family protein n=1 Tax=Owenweeksia hongkongensis TaxID=253245 RepID=UPI003A92D42F
MRKQRIVLGATFLSVFVAFGSCQKDKEQVHELSPEEGEELSAGPGTVFNDGPNAFGFQIDGLQGTDELEFFVGNSFFNQNWVQSPSSTTARDGLGPLFNSRACSGCHFKDGRGRPPLYPGEEATGLLLRLTKAAKDINGQNIGDSHYGGQFQDRSIGGVDKEGTISITYQNIEGQFADGTSYTLKQPIYSVTDLAYGPLEADVFISPRIANQVIGLGFLEAISEQQLLSWADPNDANNDGISGRPNYVWDEVSKSRTVGRFGWKANQPNLLQQSAGAFNGDMGITTSVFPNQNCAGGQQACNDAPTGGDPEIDDDDLGKVVLYVASLAVPARRDYNTQAVLEGKAIFNKINCGNCHLPKITTGQHPTMDEFSNKTIRPYTDMLLHDMGPDLADGVGDFEATETEWRTPPLWGIGLFETVNGHTRYLHDGRAENIEQAILWHGGEAENSRERYKKLPLADREKLIKFLESL